MHEAYCEVKDKKETIEQKNQCDVAMFVVTEVLVVIMEHEGFERYPGESKKDYVERYLRGFK